MVTDGIKTANQVQFQKADGTPTVPVVGDNGGIVVELADGELPVVSKPTTLYAGVITANTEEQTIGVNSEVKEISIANYSETANVTVSAASKNYTIGPNLAVDLPINKTVTNVGIAATAADTKVQYVIKGVEANGN